ncbi:MAG: hypothetical protein ACRCZ6_16585 [Kluyvera sp.]|uniref:hypothetical protein n=1 Tax=Kluyvera sp. TaxID=1538228 RepID=UPI003F40888B
MNQDEDNKSFWNIFPDRFKNGFYGYIITSFILFNWENIILVLKSKNDIEMTLIYISTQLNFTFNFFWLPLISGIAAAFIMPLISTGYSLYTGGMTAMRNDSLGFGGLLWKNIKTNLELKHSGILEIIKQSNEEVVSLKEESDELRKDNLKRLKQKENLETFLGKVVSVYQEYPLVNTETEFLEMLNTMRRRGIFEYYPGGSDIRLIKNLLAEAEGVLPPVEPLSIHEESEQGQGSNSNNHNK